MEDSEICTLTAGYLLNDGCTNHQIAESMSEMARCLYCYGLSGNRNMTGAETLHCTCTPTTLYSTVQDELCTCMKHSNDTVFGKQFMEDNANVITVSSGCKLSLEDLNKFEDKPLREKNNTDDFDVAESRKRNAGTDWRRHCVTNRTKTTTTDRRHSDLVAHARNVTSGDESREVKDRKPFDNFRSQHLPVLTSTNYKQVSFVLALFSVLQIVSSAVPTHVHRGFDMCEPIEIAMCAGMPYNMTRMPNHLHHSTQENARLAIEPYGELVKQNCSADILFFLCAMFAPICTPHFQKEAIPPCRSVCERSRRGCEPVMNKYNFSWPEDLDCDKLPEYDRGVCVSPEAIVTSMPEDKTEEKHTQPTTHRPKADCTCSKRNKPNKASFRKGKYHYAMQAMVKSITIINENASVVRVLVNSILKHGKVHIQEKRHIDLWADSDCVCPALRLHKEFLIIGHEDVMYTKLLYTPDTLVTRWKQKWVKKFKGWTKQNKKRKSKKKRCKGKPKGCRSKSKSKPRCKINTTDDPKSRKRCSRRKSNKKDRQVNRKNSIKRKNTGTGSNSLHTVTNKAGR